MTYNNINVHDPASFGKAAPSELFSPRNKPIFSSMPERILMAVIIGPLLFVMIYVASFYILALNTKPKLLSISVQHINQTGPTDDRNLGKTLHILKDKLRVNRSFLKPQQKLYLRYNLPKGTNLSVNIRRCKSLIFLEAFYCQEKNMQLKTYKLYQSGEFSFMADTPGFYIYDDTLLDQNFRPTKKPYIAVWERR